ncbi:MAG: copper amine oxidase N-terminal domain-containing protein [Pelotomaculum sp.]|nr:copper amine oxidase N-terminal domain-containing protein [Pelotomaculum sp.]
MPWLYPAMADQVNVYENRKLVKSVVFKIGVPYYVVNGQMPGVKMDVAPFIHNDRTFVPVRFLGNALGVDDSNISWDNDTQTATLKDAKAVLSMTIGKPEVVSNGAAKVIDVAPMLVDPGRTMLPARFVAEGLGYEVDWDEATQTVICWPAGQPKPDVSAMVNPYGDWPPNEINFLTGDWPGDNRMEVSYTVEEPCTDISVTAGISEPGIKSGKYDLAARQP